MSPSTAITRLLGSWRADPAVGDCIQHWQTFPARPPRTRPFPPELAPVLVEALGRQGISALYTHQYTAWERLQAGEHLMVATGTASGKSLCYNLPVLDGLLRDPQASALYLFPTRALAQDQSAALQRLMSGLPAGATLPPPVIYDGDTPAHQRAALRRSARLLLSNPDMLHIGILPHHTTWASFFRGLRYVILDEAHTYRGVFGSHVANVLRRLRRLAAFYGASPQFILASATLANPQEFAARLVEAPVTLVDDDGAGRGPQTFLIYNPPVTDPQLGLRRSALQEAVRLADDLLAAGVQTILFARTRRSVELMLAYLRASPGVSRPASPFPGEAAGQAPTSVARSETIRGYRSGYLPEERRQIERGLRQGQVRAVVATSALELGIDIGGMGAAILAGYPGTIAAARQQAGRAGRGQDAALAILVASADPLDQFLAAHPEYFFGRSPEHALVNPDHLLILLEHLRCAAFELPFQVGEAFGSLPPERLAEFLDYLAAEGQLHRSGGKYFWMADRYPAGGVPLRSVSAGPVQLHVHQPGDDPAAGGQRIGLVDRASAVWMVHPQAIYLHEAQSYLVESLDLEQGLAHLRPVASDYYTMTSNDTSLALLQQQAAAPARGGLKAWGDLQVTTRVTGFRKIRWQTHEVLGVEPLDLPPAELLTTGYWLALNENTVAQLRESGMWNSAPNDYGPKWPALREQVRRRDGYRCQACGAVEAGRTHDVHHKIPFRAFAAPEMANRLENLVTLCPACHRRAETAVRVRTGLGGLAYVLSQLAPFFLMCDPGDLGVHADPESPLTGGQPVVALYDQAPAGLGFSSRLFELHGELLPAARQLVAACACNDGCPSCTGPGGELGAGGKRETLAILEALA